MFGSTARVSGSATRTLLAAFIAVVSVALLAPASVSADPIDPGDIGDIGGIDLGPQPLLKWSMPDRFDLSPSVGVPDGNPPDPLGAEWQEYIRPPQGWTLNVDGCSSFDRDGGSIVEYEWTLATPQGDVVGTFPRSSACTAAFDGLELGFYDLKLKVWASSGRATSNTRRMEVKDLVIAVAGDSLASGEGNPEVVGDFNALPAQISQWVESDCDRSSNSGHARAARQIEQDDPTTSVTYINIACTGATTAQLMDAHWPGAIGGNRFHPPQMQHLAAALCDDDASRTIRAQGRDALLDQAAWGSIDADCTQAASRPVDSMFLSIGVNDIGFRKVLLNCADISFASLQTPQDIASWVDQFASGGALGAILDGFFDVGCNEDDDVSELVSDGYDAIDGVGSGSGVLDRVAAEIDAAGLVSDGVYLVDYPHHVFTEPPGGNCSGAFERIEEDEILYLNNVNLLLNQKLRFAANRLGWYSAPLFRSDEWLGHGYCDADPWFVTLSESVGQYNNQTSTINVDGLELPITFGILHPNAQGHDQIRQFIMEEYVERSRPITNRVTVQFDSLRIEDPLTYTGLTSPPANTMVVRVNVARIGLDGEPARWEQVDELNVPLVWQQVGTNSYKQVPQTLPPGAIEDPGNCPAGVCPAWDGTYDVGLNAAERLVVEVTTSLRSVGDEVECPPGLPSTPGVPGNPGIPGANLLVIPAVPGDGGGGGGGTCTVNVSRGLIVGDTYFISDADGFGAGGTYTESAADPYTGEGGLRASYTIGETPTMEPPVADAGGAYSVFEGHGDGTLTLDGTGSADPDGDAAALSYAWTGLAVEPPDSPTPTYPTTDDGGGPVTLTVTDSDGLTDSDDTTVEVLNADPTVSLEGASISEGDTVVLQGSYTDPGVVDTHTATVDWADDAAGPEALDLAANANGTGTFTVERALGDDGTFEVTVEVTDDDGGTAVVTATVTVANVAPQVGLGSETVDLPGGEHAVTRRDESTPVTAAVTDPGSDDLTFEWSTGRTTTLYNDGVGADPDPSPGPTFPTTGSDSAEFNASDPGVHVVSVAVSDDDGGSASAETAVLVTGDMLFPRPRGWWIKQMRQRGWAMPAEDLQGMIDVVEAASSVFGDAAGEVPLHDLDAVAERLRAWSFSARSRLERQLLVSWLNIASGATPLDRRFPTTDGWRSALELLTAAEAVWSDPDSSSWDLYRATWPLGWI